MLVHLIALGAGLVSGSTVVFIDKSNEFFNKQETEGMSAIDVADAVARASYLRAINDGSYTSLLRMPRFAPVANVLMTIDGVEPTDLPTLNGYVPSSLQAGQVEVAASLLASAFHGIHTEADSWATSDNVHKNAQVADTLIEDYTTVLPEVQLDRTDKVVQDFLKELQMSYEATKTLGESQPQMFFVHLTTIPSLTEEQKPEALKAVNNLVANIMESMPEKSTAEIMFPDKVDLRTIAIERLGGQFSTRQKILDSQRRRLQEDDGATTTTGEPTTTTTSASGTVQNVTLSTYMEAYTTQIKYWFAVSAVLIVYFFSFCFGTMIYDEDKMLYTTFDANRKP